MEFFSKIGPLMDGLKKVTITIQKKGDKLTVGFLPEAGSKEVNDKLNLLSVTGTAEDLDQEFFNATTKVAETIKRVSANVEQVEADLQKLEDQKKGKLKGKQEQTNKKAADKKADHKKGAKPAVEATEEQTENTDTDTPKETQTAINF